MISTDFESSEIRSSSPPSSTNLWAVISRFTFAARIAALRFFDPAVKFSIAGTRP